MIQNVDICQRLDHEMWTQSNKDQFATALLDKDNNHSAIRRNTCASISADESKLSDCHFFWGFLKNPGLMEPDGNSRRRKWCQVINPFPGIINVYDLASLCVDWSMSCMIRWLMTEPCQSLSCCFNPLPICLDRNKMQFVCFLRQPTSRHKIDPQHKHFTSKVC